MKFGAVEIQHAVGKILAHNLSNSAGRRVIRKGTLLEDQHIQLLGEIGLTTVYVAELEEQDIKEELAAPHIAAILSGDHIELRGAASGRTNLVAVRQGLVRIDQERLDLVNQIPGITIATLAQSRVAAVRSIVASIKVIPYALPREAMHQVESIADASGPIIALHPLEQKRVALILTGMLGLRKRLERDFGPPLEERIEGLGSEITSVEFHSTQFPDIVDQLGRSLSKQVEAGIDLILLAGETAIMDERDIVPQAILQAGGEIECLGAPVDPGNLLLLGRLAEIPVLGVPGCARSRKENVVDWVLPRLLAGEHLTRLDIVSLGVGGLLEDVRERPQSREEA